MSLAIAEFCRRRAEECHQNAANARDHDVKAGWRTLESSWSILAQHFEADVKNNARPTAQPGTQFLTQAPPVF